VKQKPQISKKADSILKGRQEQAFEWLFTRATNGETVLTNETLRWDLIPTEVLACMMPMLMKMREDTSITF